jgi:hypothetical protein
MRRLVLLCLLFCPSLYAAPTDIASWGFEETGGVADCSNEVLNNPKDATPLSDFYNSDQDADLMVCNNNNANTGSRALYSKCIYDGVTTDERTQVVLRAPNVDGGSYLQFGGDKTVSYWLGFAMLIPNWDLDVTDGKQIDIFDVHHRPEACDSNQIETLQLKIRQNGTAHQWNLQLIGQNGSAACSTGRTNHGNINVGPVVTGRWVNYVFKFVYSYLGAGEFSMWADGNLAYDISGINIGYNSAANKQDFLKFGVYQSGACKSGGGCSVELREVYYDDITIAKCDIGEDCYDVVAPGATPPGSHCSNGVQDGDETGIDCGGSCAPCTPEIGPGVERPQADLLGRRDVYEIPFLGQNDTCRSGWTCESLELPTGTPACAGASGVGNAANEYIVRDCAGFANINNAAYDKIFACPVDCPTTDVTLTESRASNDKKWFGWWTDGSYSEAEHSINTPDVAQARVQNIILNGADNWLIDRLWLYEGISITDSSSSENNIFNRITAEQPDAQDIVYVGVDNQSNYFQRSVFRNCTQTAGVNYSAAQVRKGATDTRFVYNQMEKCFPIIYAPDSGATDYLDALIIHNNDFAGLNSGGTKTCGGPAIAIGSPTSGTSSAEWGRIEYNRFRRFRAADAACAGTFTKGGAIWAFGNAQYGLVRSNYIDDSISLFRADTGASATNWSFINNIGYQITDQTGAETSYFIDGGAGLDNHEVYFNTCHTCDSPINRGNTGEFKANVLIDSGALTGTWGASGKEDYNTYTNSTKGSEANVLEYTNAQWTPVFDDLNQPLFYITGPDSQIVPDIVPTASSPAEFKTFMGTNKANLDPGAGLGVE